MPHAPSSRGVVHAALVGNLLVALTKSAAAAWTGSSSMASEAVHSFVDTGNEVLLLYGMRRSAQRPDAGHPLGYGRELYFWSFIVALLIFALGAGVSLYEGIVHLRQPQPISDAAVNYVVLSLAFVFEGASWRVSLRQFRSAKGELGYYEAFRRSKDPPSFMVLFEDSAALLGLLIALAGVAAAQWLKMPRLDGAASIAIGVVLAVSSLLLARETKGLLIGESAHPKVRDAILRIAGDDEDVRSANGVLTVQMGPDQVVAALSAEFRDGLDSNRIEACVNRVEAAIKQAYPVVSVLFVKPQTRAVWERRTSGLDDGS